MLIDDMGEYGRYLPACQPGRRIAGIYLYWIGTALLSLLYLASAITHITKAMEAAGVPCGPINTLDKVFDDPQARARGMRIELPHPVAGTVPLVANPIRMSASPVAYRRAPPGLGEHTAEVLDEWLGKDFQLEPARKP